MNHLTEAGRHADEWPRWKHVGWIVLLIAAPWFLLAGLVLAAYVVARWAGIL